MTKAGIAAPKANSQAYPVDVILPSRLLSPCAGVRRRGRCQATSSGLSFLRWRTKRQKRTKALLPKPWPRTAHCERFGALCAIHKANVTVALLFQTLIEMKKGPPIACTRAALGTNRRSLGGDEGVRRFMETNSVRSTWFREWKKKF